MPKINNTMLISKKNQTIYNKLHKKMKFPQKRRNAICFHQEQVNIKRNQIQKSQQAISRIMISFKNDIFLKNLSWDQINKFIQNGVLFQTDQENTVIKAIDEPISEYFVVLSGQVVRKNKFNEIDKVYYTGQSFCHESFVSSIRSLHMYICSDSKTQIFALSGSYINESVTQIYRKKIQFYQKAFMNKQQFNYLDIQQRDKLINSFKQRHQIPNTEFIFRNDSQQIGQKAPSPKRLYIVLNGVFAKCKKTLTGELQTFKTLKSGDFFGQESLLYNGQIDYCVICLQDNSSIAYIDKSQFQKVIDSYDKITKRSKLQAQFNNKN